MTTVAMSFALLLSHSAMAQAVDDKTRNAARSLAEQGRDVYDKGDFEKARDLFHRAYSLVPAPTIALYEGRSLAKLGRLVQAQEAYLRAVRTPISADSPEPFRKAVHEAESEETALEPRIPKVTLVVAGPGAEGPELSVSVDGEPTKAELLGVEMPINPGPHVILAAAKGGEQARVAFSINEREVKSVDVKVPAAKLDAPPKVVVTRPPAPPPDKPVASRSTWQKPAAFAAGGLGIAGLATGIITGSMAASRYSDAKSECPNRRCVEGSAGQDKLDSFRSLRTVSTIGYIVGGVGLAASVTLFVLAPSSAHAEGSASAGIWLGSNSAGVMGAF
jgi:hypothetical protein